MEGDDGEAHGACLQPAKLAVHAAVKLVRKRIALVVGNSKYGSDENDWLPNAAHDADDMAAELRELGFEVIRRIDLNRAQMKAELREFGTRIKDADVALFYYAGHGVSVQGTNYLIPIDADINSEQEVEFEALDAGFAIAQLDAAGDALNIIILDACRDNPFSRSYRSMSRGLAPMHAPTGTLIAYSTGPGEVASDGTQESGNGLYTSQLLRYMKTPGLDLEDIFKSVRASVVALSNKKQVPWEHSSVVSDFYFVDPRLPRIDASCNNENGTRTVETGDATSFELRNESSAVVELYWLDREGRRIKYKELAPGSAPHKQHSYMGHQWVITDTRGKCLQILQPPGQFHVR